MNKKTKLAILGVVALVLVTLGLTYAYWLVTRTQDKENVITAGCLDISLTNEQNDINLTEQFPISDEEGKSLTPYTFTVTNNCNTTVDYYVNLEALGDSATAMSASSLKVMLNESTPKILNSNYEDAPTIDGAYTSYRLGFGTLAAKGSADYSLRLWIDAEAPISEMNKTFSSKISVTIGQGVNNPLKEGTIAYDLVSQYGGQDAIKTLSAEVKETEWKTASIGFTETTAATTYEWGTSYVFDAEKGFAVSGNVVEANMAECVEGTKTCGNYLIRSQSDNGEAYKDTIFMLDDFEADNAGTSSVNFSGKSKTSSNEYESELVYTDNVANMFTIADDYGMSYYLSGDIENNFVQFGTYAESETITTVDGDANEYTYSVTAGSPIYWRIMRINGDGTIRLAYDGPEKISIDINSGVYNNNATIGYSAMTDGNLGLTYTNENGEQVDSPIKDFLDAWYEKHLKTNYGKYIADAIFCEDKEEASYIDETGAFTEDSSIAVGTAYNSYLRLSTYSPKLACTRDEDKYTVSSKNGNGYLTNPIGILNADENLISGEFASYGYAGSWLMSPLAYMDDYYYGINLGDILPGSEQAPVRPVINLKADVAFTGDGSYENPYVITTN